MKLKAIQYFVLAAVLSVVGISSAQAEADQVERANIPFDFYAGNQHMPAGTYTIGLDLQGDIITLNDGAGHAAILMGVPAGDDGNYESQLVFDHSGDSYFLQEVKSDVLDVDLPTTKGKASRTESARVPLVANQS